MGPLEEGSVSQVIPSTKVCTRALVERRNIRRERCTTQESIWDAFPVCFPCSGGRSQASFGFLSQNLSTRPRQMTRCFPSLRQSPLECGSEEKDQENEIQGNINDWTKIKQPIRHRNNDSDNGKQEQEDGTDQPSSACPPLALS